MHLTHLSLTNFRSFARLDVDIPRRVVLLTGGNAQGKTSILEAVYFLAAFTSFQTHVDRQLVNFIEAKNEMAVGRLIAEYTRGSMNHHMEARLILEPFGATGKRLRKEFLLDGVKRPMGEIIGHFSAVIFVPQMSQIIEGGPENRRRYINLALVQGVPEYAAYLSEYGEVLTRRNALLKTLFERGGDQSQLDYWDDKVVHLGSMLIYRRIEAIHEIGKLASEIHHNLTNSSEVLRMDYQPSYDPIQQSNGQIAMTLTTPVHRSGIGMEEIQNGFRALLQSSRPEDIRRGSTQFGPHRDDVRFLANGVDLGEYGSRGQGRTTLISLKLAEVEWLKWKKGEWPVLLMDEIMAELDTRRRADLLTFIGNTEQVILTTTDTHPFSKEFIEKASIWQVEAGKVVTT
jgi:DNA replication and repair protein RecF